MNDRGKHILAVSMDPELVAAVRQAAAAEEYTDMSSFVRRTLAARVRELGFIGLALLARCRMVRDDGGPADPWRCRTALG
jgi:hypothetical protein